MITMSQRIPDMTDSRQSVTDEQLFDTLASGDRPVWTSTAIAERHGITRQTANTRLSELESEYDEVVSIDVGRAAAYYVPHTETLPPGETLKERHELSIIRHYEDKFVGLPSEPWTAVHPDDGPATGGDKVQLQVEGTPSDWNHTIVRTWDNRRRGGLQFDETAETDTQALISGTLYEKPTAPIKHVEIPDDYDLEGNTGAKYKEFEGHSRRVLIATGAKNWLLRPSNDAVFLTDVSVDWISIRGEVSDLRGGDSDAPGISDDIDLAEEIEEIEATDNPL